MNFKLILVSFIILFSSITFGQGTSSLTRVVIIRHGEKSENGDNLSCKGLNRSLQLAGVLKSKFGAFDHVFVPTLKASNSTTHSRMFQTITPYLVRENLSVSSKYDESDINGVASAIKKQTGTVLVVWEHKNIRKIVRALGIQEVQKWEDSDFDSILILNYHNGTPTLSSDKEGITPSATCN